MFAALINGLLLVFASGAIVWEAIHRFMEPQSVNGALVMATAGVGVVVNGLTALMFMRGRESDANVRGAFLHMAGDALISVGVIVAGLLVTLTHIQWIDPLASIVIVLVILWGTWGLLRDAIDMAMDAAPRSVNMDKLRSFLCSQPGVAEVHDLHVWSMGAASSAMTRAPGDARRLRQRRLPAGTVQTDRPQVRHRSTRPSRSSGNISTAARIITRPNAPTLAGGSTARIRAGSGIS